MTRPHPDLRPAADFAPGAAFRRLLSSVKRPARYIGGEFGAWAKESLPPGGVRLCLAFPDVYEVGMSYLGYQILYALVKGLDWADAERAYCPWPDMEAAMRGAGEPMRSLETRRPLSEFDAVGFTLQYELCATNILTMLDLGGVPLTAADRGDGDPIVVAGGSGALAPAPLEIFFDVFLLGDGEELLPEFLASLRETKGRPRAERLEAAAAVPGVYVPGVNGTPSRPARRRAVRVLDEAFFPTSMIVPNMSVIHDRAAVQVFRGCTRGCRFCRSGMIERPVRERGAASASGQLAALLEATGWEEAGLLSLATCDWSGLPELLAASSARLAERGAKLSLPSLRVDAFSVGLAASLGEMRRGGLTFAPEAGTQRLRDVINKNVTDADIEAALGAAFGGGWDRVKLYFMMGLPTETDDDLDGIAELASRAFGIAKSRGRRGEIAISLAGFVPKPQTPFQWEAQASREELLEKGRRVKGRIKNKRISVAYHEPEQTRLEGVFARAGRELGGAILEAWRRGARFDGWTETFSPALWDEVFRDTGIDADALCGPRGVDELLPWDGIDAGVTREFLLRERELAFAGRVSPDCRSGECAACGCEDICHGGAAR